MRSHDDQAALAEKGFEAWVQGFHDFAKMAPGVAVDLAPVRRDMELYAKRSERLQATTGSFRVLTSRRPFVLTTPSTATPPTATTTSTTTTSLDDPTSCQFGGARGVLAKAVARKAHRHPEPRLAANSGAAARRSRDWSGAIRPSIAGRMPSNSWTWSVL